MLCQYYLLFWLDLLQISQTNLSNYVTANLLVSIDLPLLTYVLMLEAPIINRYAVITGCR